ncbi:MAG: hypothetical protein F6K03_05805 [Kamptonema sp. SIO4C4]|nr:hypothetical protein [Kamptonema sp. SIO4C4]
MNPVYASVAEAIDQRSQAYISKHSDQSVQIGSILFDRDRKILVQSAIGTAIFQQMC